LLKNMIGIALRNLMMLALLSGFLSGCLSTNHFLETERTVVMDSYFNETVRKAVAEDIHTRINASYLNLETGQTTETANPDIIYQLSCGSACFPLIVGTEKVKMSPVSFQEPFSLQKPTKQECETLLMNKERPGMGMVIPKQGWFTCVQTCTGRIGWIRYDKDFYSGLKLAEIQFTYWLWK